MSKYTTGEIAKLCDVSVRTVPYDDTRNLLVPSELSDGGRRLYTEQDVSKLRIICFLRDAGLSIGSIGQLLAEQDPGSVISVLLDQQKKEVEADLKAVQKKREMLDGISRNLKMLESVDFHSLGDIAHIMKSKEKLKKARMVLLATVVPFGILKWTSIFLWIFQGIWWPFAVYTLLAVPYILWAVNYYWRKISYICPQCHAVFKPDKKEFFFATHTSTTRRLACTCCGHKGFCIETAGEAPSRNREV